MQKLGIFIIAILLFSACRYKSGSGNIVTEVRETGSFTGIRVSGGFEVELRHAGNEEVIVEADDNIIKYINTNVRKGELVINLDDLNVHDAHLKVLISAPSINSIKVSAGSDFIAKDELKSDGIIILKASSGSKIKTAVDAPGVEADASSAGEISISGRTKDFNAETSSGASILAKELLSENTVVQASSGSTAKVHASVKLEATASSGANVSYRGAASVQKSTSSGGAVEKE